jgi:hypothetical protein
MVTSPNITLTLEAVPVWMAGVAGGALQTGQRVGAAVGTAALAGLFSTVLDGTDGDYSVAISDTLLGAVGVMLVALALAVAELVRRRALGPRPEPTPRPEHHIHHL